MEVDDEILKLIPGNSIPTKRPRSGSGSSTSSNTRIKLQQAQSTFFAEKPVALLTLVNTIEQDPQNAEKIKNAQSYYMKKAKETSTGLWIEGPSIANPIIPSFLQ